MVSSSSDPTLLFVLGSIGLLLFGAMGYGIYTTVGPKSKDLRDTIKEHARMHELGIAHGHGGNKDAYKISGKLNHDHPDSLLG